MAEFRTDDVGILVSCRSSRNGVMKQTCLLHKAVLQLTFAEQGQLNMQCAATASQSQACKLRTQCSHTRTRAHV